MNRLPIVLFALFCAFQLSAQDSLNRIGWTDGAACYSIKYHNGYIYTGNGNTLNAHLASGLPPYQETFRYKFVSNIDDIQVKGNDLFVAVNHSGLYKFSLTDPAIPQLVTSYKPDDFSEAAYDISFYGQDTIFLTYKSKVAVFQDLGTSFGLLTTFGPTSANAIIRGGAIKDTLYAYAVSFTQGAGQDGIYLIDARDFTQYSFWPQTYGEPEEILFSQSNNLMNVLGGTQSWSNPLDPKGCFYSLDVSDPYNPAEIYYDTVNTIWGFGISAPMNGVNINDTLYIATNAAMAHDYAPLDPAYGHVYVYDVSDTANVGLIESIYAGLWHFDVDIQDDTLLHIASEWYGIETMDISDLTNEVQLGKTLTGGWNWGTGVKGDTMVVCNGGYGYKVFDISDPYNPALVTVNYDSNFVKSAEFSEDGNYLYAYYFTNDGFRVFETSNYTQVGSLSGSYGHEKTFRYNDMLMSIEDPSFGATRVHFIDVSNPTSPTLSLTRNYAAHDMHLGDNGKLFVCHNDSLAVWDLNNNFQTVAYVEEGIFKYFKCVAAYQDTVYAYVTNKGLVRYIYDGANSLVEDMVVSLPYGEPKYIAADAFGVYLCYVEYGLFAYDKVTMTEESWYEHGLEFISPGQWGPRDLFCQDEKIFLVEWFGQTTILTNDNGLLSVVNKPQEKEEVKVYPNPSVSAVTISFPNSGKDAYALYVYDLAGNEVHRRENITGNVVILDKEELKSGYYIYCLQSEGEVIHTGKIRFD